MKILQVISNLGNGGAEKFTIELSNELAKNHEVTLVCFRPIETHWMFPKLIDQNVKLITLGKKSGFSLILFFKIFKILWNLKPNVVHFHLDSTVKYIYPLIYFFRKTKFVYTIHCNLTKSNAIIFKFLNNYKLQKKNITFVCISTSILEEFKSKFLNLKFRKIDNGIKTAQKNDYKIEFNKINFVSIGRIFEQKNYTLLCALMKNYSNLQAIVIGDLDHLDNEYYKKIQKQIPANVHFIGKKENIGDYLIQADAFVMTSLFEGLPISALEALSLGVPVLTTPAGGMVDLIENGINGFVSQDFSEESFVRIIDKFLSLSAEEINIIKQNNINKFNAKYNISQCAENYLKTYLN